MEVSKGDILITDRGYIKCVVSTDGGDIRFDDGSSVDVSGLERFRILYNGRGFVESEWGVKQCCNFISSTAKFSAKLLEEANNICFEIYSLLNEMDYTAPIFQKKIPSMLEKLKSLGLMSAHSFSAAGLKLGEMNLMIEKDNALANSVLAVVASETIEAIDAMTKSLVTIVDFVNGFEPEDN